MAYNLIVFYAVDKQKEADYEFEEDVEELGYAQAINRSAYYVCSNYSGKEAFARLSSQLIGKGRLLIFDTTSNTYHHTGVNSHIIAHIQEHWAK